MELVPTLKTDDTAWHRLHHFAADVLGRRVIVSQDRVPDVSRLDDDDVRARFREAAAEVLSTAAVERVVTLVADLPELTDYSELFELFASAPCHGAPAA